jgi:hypothetical protein
MSRSTGVTCCGALPSTGEATAGPCSPLRTGTRNGVWKA